MDSRLPPLRLAESFGNGVQMQRVNLVAALLMVTGCANETDFPNDRRPAVAQPESSPIPAIEADDDEKEIYFFDSDGTLTVEGTLEGTWLRQTSGKTLGELTKGTILEPLRIKVGSRSLPLLGKTEELEHTLLKYSGKRVRLSGEFRRWIENGRGVPMIGQAGYTGPIPAHVVEFMIVRTCQVIVRKSE